METTNNVVNEEEKDANSLLQEVASDRAEIININPEMSDSEIKKAEINARQQANLQARLDKEKERLDKHQERLDKSQKRLEKKQAKLVKKMEEAKKPRRARGDRKDGKLLRDIDAMHIIMPLIYPNRCDNEAYISDVVDLTKTNEYIRKINEGSELTRLSPFDIIVAAALKTIMHREKMNRFIVNGNTYQRFDYSASFVVKKHFNDEGEEGLALVKATGDDTLKSIYRKIVAQIREIKDGDVKDASSEAMDTFTKKLPSPVRKLAVGFIRILDRHGKVPQSLIDSDPYYSSIVLTNVGSLKLQSGYHHLTNWGTNSFFISVGEKKLRPFYDRRGEMVLHDSIDISLTIDERIADGYYYSKTIRLFKKLVENPELMEKPFSEPIIY